MARPAQLQLISTRSSRATPSIVLAPSPQAGSLTAFRVDPLTFRCFHDDALRHKVGEYAGLVHGNVLEMSLTGDVVPGGTSGLLGATALFRGLKRPRDDESRDETTLIYVSNPGQSYVFPSLSGDIVKACDKPRNSVFVTYVDLLPHVEHHSSGCEVFGAIRFWEWVVSAPNTDWLPHDWSTRYVQQLW